MSLSTKEIAQLKKLVSIAEKIIAAHAKSNLASNAAGKGRPAARKRIRRSGRELVEFRKMLRAERSKGASAAALAKKYSVSQAYIYQL